MKSEDLSEDLKELTAVYAEPDPDEIDKKNALVRIYRTPRRSGYFWEVNFPIEKKMRGGRNTYWTYDRYGGYSMTSIGARFSVKMAFRKHDRELRREMNVQWKVPVDPADRNYSYY